VLLLYESYVSFYNNVLVVEKIVDYFQPEEAPNWDPELCGYKLTLRDNNRAVSKINAYGFANSVQSAKPCSKYSVQLVEGKDVMIGFAQRHGFQKNTSNFFKCGWFFDFADGALWSQNGTAHKAYGNHIPVGSMVTAIHDKTHHTIEFQVNGTSLGIAYSNIPYDKLFAAADFYGPPDGEIRIVDYS
jgi:hypothetical protein